MRASPGVERRNERKRLAAGTWGRQRCALLGACDFSVTALLLPVLLVPPSRFPVDFPGVALAASVFSPVVYRAVSCEVDLRVRHGNEFAQALVAMAIWVRVGMGMSGRVKRLTSPRSRRCGNLCSKARVRSTPVPARAPMEVNGQRTGCNEGGGS